MAFTVAIGGTPAVAHALPYGANVSSPADLFLTVHGRGGESRRRIDSRARRDAEGEARSQTAPVHHQGRPLRLGSRGEHGPAVGRRGTVGRRARSLSGAGGECDRDHARGSRGLSRPAAIFNAAFRFQEPFQGPDFTVLTDATWWRDRVQGRALRDGDLGRFHAEVDFGKLLAGVDDDMPGQPGGVPQDGPMNRILASRFETAQGIDFSTVCLGGTLPAVVQGRVPRAAAAVCDLRAAQAGAGRRLRVDAPASLARRHVQPVLDLAQPVAVRRTRRGLDRRHAACARAGRVLLRPCRGGRVRGVGRRGAPLRPRSGLDRGRRLLDGRLRRLQAGLAVPRPVRARADDRRPTRHQPAPIPDRCCRRFATSRC